MMLRESGTEINRRDVARAKPCRVSLFGDPRNRCDPWPELFSHRSEWLDCLGKKR
jgi:hypothetical protein